MSEETVAKEEFEDFVRKTMRFYADMHLQRHSDQMTFECNEWPSKSCDLSQVLFSSCKSSTDLGTYREAFVSETLRKLTSALHASDHGTLPSMVGPLQLSIALLQLTDFAEMMSPSISLMRENLEMKSDRVSSSQFQIWYRSCVEVAHVSDKLAENELTSILYKAVLCRSSEVAQRCLACMFKKIFDPMSSDKQESAYPIASCLLDALQCCVEDKIPPIHRTHARDSLLQLVRSLDSVFDKKFELCQRAIKNVFEFLLSKSEESLATIVCDGHLNVGSWITGYLSFIRDHKPGLGDTPTLKEIYDKYTRQIPDRRNRIQCDRHAFFDICIEEILDLSLAETKMSTQRQTYAIKITRILADKFMKIFGRDRAEDHSFELSADEMFLEFDPYNSREGQEYAINVQACYLAVLNQCVHWLSLNIDQTNPLNTGALEYFDNLKMRLFETIQTFDAITAGVKSLTKYAYPLFSITVNKSTFYAELFERMLVRFGDNYELFMNEVSAAVEVFGSKSCIQNAIQAQFRRYLISHHEGWENLVSLNRTAMRCSLQRIMDIHLWRSTWTSSSNQLYQTVSTYMGLVKLDEGLTISVFMRIASLLGILRRRIRSQSDLESVQKCFLEGTDNIQFPKPIKHGDASVVCHVLLSLVGLSIEKSPIVFATVAEKCFESICSKILRLETAILATCIDTQAIKDQQEDDQISDLHSFLQDNLTIFSFPAEDPKVDITDILQCEFLSFEYKSFIQRRSYKL